MKIFNDVQSNHVWMIKDNCYCDYLRIVGNVFVLINKTLIYEN
jgi:hypothetical protein